MGHVYLPGDQWEPGNFPAGLAIGDSWFWYPFNNLLASLVNHPRISDDHSAIQMIGYDGALLQEFIGSGKYADTLKHYLDPKFGSFSEFYISAAGNDAVDYHLCLRNNCGAAQTPQDCFDPTGMNDFLATISTALVAVIHQIRWSYPNAPIFLNGYDYPVPDGRGFLNLGPWLKPALDNARVPSDMHFRIGATQILIDRLNDDVLVKLAAANPNVIHIESRGTLSHYLPSYTNDWANELHPTVNGFSCIVNNCWIEPLSNFGITLTSKQNDVVPLTLAREEAAA